MEVDDFDPAPSRSGPIPTNPRLQPGIGAWNLVPPAPAVDPPGVLPRIGDNLNQSSQRQQLRRRDTQLIRNQGTDFQLPRPISLPPANTQLQRHPRQPNSPIQNSILDNPNVNTTSRNETVAHLVNMGASRPSQGSTDLHTNIDPGVSRQLQNPTTEISTNSPVEQRSPIYLLLPETMFQSLPQSRKNLARYERALEQVRSQVMIAASSRNIQQLQTIRDTLAETKKKCQMEQANWRQALAIARTQRRSRPGASIKDIEEVVDRAKQLCSEYESFVRSVENLLHLLQQQQQQQQSPQNPMLNPSLGGDNGAGPQTPWNFPVAQNPSLSAQTPVQNQEIMNAVRIRVGENPPNYKLGGPNSITIFPPNFKALQNHPDNRPPGANMPPNAAQNQNDPDKAKFSKFLATVNIDPLIHLYDRTIEMWVLYRAVQEFDSRFGEANPAKFRLIGYQLGLPPDGQQTQTSVQAAYILQGYYNRLEEALRNTASMTWSSGQQSAQPLVQASHSYLAQLDPAISISVDKNMSPSTTTQVAASSINATLPRPSSSGMIGIEPIVSNNDPSLGPASGMEPLPSDSSPFEISGLVRKVRKRAVFEGTYSTVFIGEYRDTKVAIKEIRTVTTSRVTERKFHRELQTWWRLRHPNILPLLGYIHEDDTNEIYRALISPWMENKTAVEYIQRDLSPSQRLSLFGDVINGLQYLHNFQPVIVHADLKPHNVLITEDGVGQICDFGLVRLLQEDMPTGMTTTTAHTGTTRYLAYELVRNMGKAIPTTATDIYALGCLGMEFVYRHPPHHDLGENTLGILKRIERGHHPANLPTDEAGDLTLLGTLLNSCWAINSAARPNINNVYTWFWDNHSNILSGL